jgi:iron complex transport system ATP-binding protein
MKLLELDTLKVSIGGRIICHDLSLSLETGQMLGVLGRNGIGKTTLLYTVMGLHPAAGGRVRLQGIDTVDLSRRQLARRMGMLFQENDTSMPATVLETALLGRHPYSQQLLWDSAEDIAMARDVLLQVGLDALEQRQVATLSGGEKQRLAIAMLLAQCPRLYVLDEPSNHLDIDFQLQILDLLKQRIFDQPAAILMASHDINLVSRYCDRVMLMLDADEIIEGPTEAVLTPENLQRAFRCKVAVAELEGYRYFLPT